MRRLAGEAGNEAGHEAAAGCTVAHHLRNAWIELLRHATAANHHAAARQLLLECLLPLTCCSLYATNDISVMLFDLPELHFTPLS